MKDAEHRLSWALQVCLQAQMRLTPTREKILAFLAAQPVPVSLEAVIQAEGIRGSCSLPTAYRTLMLFRELEVIRQVSLPNKISYFILNFPAENTHFLVCRCCGMISELQTSKSITAMEQEIESLQRYARLYHELIFFGICPDCQKHPPGVVCAKLQPRMRPTGRFNARPLPLN